MSDIQHIGGRTPDLTEENVDKLVALFPDVLTEVTDQQTGKAESGDYDDDGGQLVVNPESNGRFHSDWCSMIYPRLLLARDLLASDGVIFISIDENESANLKKICDEVFGNECFVNKVIWRSSDNSNNDAKQFSNDYNDILIYSKKPGWQPNRLQDPEKRRHFKNPDNDPRGAWFDGDPLNSPNYRENLRYEIVAPNGNIIKPPANGWRWSKETLDQKMKSGEIYFNEKQTNIKRRTYLQDNPEQFIAKVSRLIIEQKAAMIVDHISYDRIQGEYDSTIFANAGGRDETDAIRVSKCVQDWVFPDGDPKKGRGSAIHPRARSRFRSRHLRQAAARLPNPHPGRQLRSRLGRRLPRGQRVEAYLLHRRNQRHYEQPELRGIEDSKIRCAERLFNELQLAGDVHYEQADTYEKLMERVRSL